VTLVTDLPTSQRLAYVGIDNRAAGATAAYLLGQWLRRDPGDILVVRGSGLFRGEDEREMGFRGTMRAAFPDRRQIDVIDRDNVAERLREQVGAALADNPGVRAAYSMYSMGNAAVVDAFRSVGRECVAYVAHDLNDETLELLRTGELSAVLHHDLGQDMRRACQVVMQAQRALPGPIRSWPSSIQVITPHNIPVGFPWTTHVTVRP
jgi:LacI family transcriptional regulator